MKPAPEARFAHSPHIAWRRVREEAVLLDTRTSVYYSLNPTAARAWELLGEGLPVSGVAERLSEEFLVSPQEAAGDVQDLVKSLSREELVSAAP